MITIYHNGECSKSKGALEILQEQGVEFEVRYYLIESPTIEELKDVLQKLRLNVNDIVRKNEPVYLERYEGKEMNEDEWLSVLTGNPELIERPIVVNGNKAIVARPPEKVLEIL
jgi:arsenate reductase